MKNTTDNSERLAATDGSGKLVEVQEELRRMAAILGSTVEGEVCELAADIVAQSGKQAVELNSIRAILSDANAVRVNMLRGTIAWTPETLRHVLGDSSQNAEASHRTTKGN